MDRGMGLFLTVGWLLLGAYLIALLALSGIIVVFEYIGSRLKLLHPHKPLKFQEVDHS